MPEHIGIVARDAFRCITTRLAAESCDSVILDCTEIPLLGADDSPLRTLDSTRLLAKAAVRLALA